MRVPRKKAAPCAVEVQEIDGRLRSDRLSLEWEPAVKCALNSDTGYRCTGMEGHSLEAPPLDQARRTNGRCRAGVCGGQRIPAPLQPSPEVTNAARQGQTVRSAPNQGRPHRGSVRCPGRGEAAAIANQGRPRCQAGRRAPTARATPNTAGVLAVTLDYRDPCLPARPHSHDLSLQPMALQVINAPPIPGERQRC